MKKKIISFLDKNLNFNLNNFLKNKIDKNNLNFNQENQEKEIKLLRKENKILKDNFSKFAIEKLKNRRSIRKFSDKKVDFKLVYDILESGLNAPCVGNIQNYRLIVVTDKKVMENVAKICMQQFWMQTANLFIVVVRDDIPVLDMYPQLGEKFSIQNISAVAQNIITASSMLGLGSCWVECVDNQILKEELKVPINNSIDAIIPIGYSLEFPKVDKVETSNMIFFEEFGNKFK